MAKITYVDFNGTKREVTVENGMNLMEGAVTNMVPGIDGDCGGACACATCHVHVDPAWLSKLPPMEDLEDMMLGLVDSRDENSRLSCQLKAAPELDGLILNTPQGQH